MCVIVTKLAGSPMPSDQIIKSMWDNNPDGAGIAYAINNRVHVEKGYMKYKDLDNALAGLSKRLKTKYNKTLDDVAVMIHFRITTHGGTSPQLTHPFPIVNGNEQLHATEYMTDIVVAHNGIIHSVTAGSGHSDTSQYIKDILVPLKNYSPFFMYDPNLVTLMENTIDSSRLTFLSGDGRFAYVGSWQEDPETPGCKYSNLLHTYNPNPKYSTPYPGYWMDSDGFGNPVKAKRIPEGATLVYGTGSTFPFYETADSDIYDYWIDEDDNVLGTDKDEIDFAWHEYYESVQYNGKELNYNDIKTPPKTLYLEDIYSPYYYEGTVPYSESEPDTQDNSQTGLLQKVPKSKG